MSGLEMVHIISCVLSLSSDFHKGMLGHGLWENAHGVSQEVMNLIHLEFPMSFYQNLQNHRAGRGSEDTVGLCCFWFTTDSLHFLLEIAPSFPLQELISLVLII